MRASLLSMWEPTKSNRKIGFALMASTNKGKLDLFVKIQDQDLTPGDDPANPIALDPTLLAKILDWLPPTSCGPDRLAETRPRWNLR